MFKLMWLALAIIGLSNFETSFAVEADGVVESIVMSNRGFRADLATGDPREISETPFDCTEGLGCVLTSGLRERDCEGLTSRERALRPGGTRGAGDDGLEVSRCSWNAAAGCPCGSERPGGTVGVPERLPDSRDI